MQEVRHEPQTIEEADVNRQFLSILPATAALCQLACLCACSPVQAKPHLLVRHDKVQMVRGKDTSVHFSMGEIPERQRNGLWRVEILPPATTARLFEAWTFLLPFADSVRFVLGKDSLLLRNREVVDTSLHCSEGGMLSLDLSLEGDTLALFEFSAFQGRAAYTRISNRIGMDLRFSGTKWQSQCGLELALADPADSGWNLVRLKACKDSLMLWTLRQRGETIPAEGFNEVDLVLRRNAGLRPPEAVNRKLSSSNRPVRLISRGMTPVDSTFRALRRVIGGIDSLRAQRKPGCGKEIFKNAVEWVLEEDLKPDPTSLVQMSAPMSRLPALAQEYGRKCADCIPEAWGKPRKPADLRSVLRVQLVVRPEDLRIHGKGRTRESVLKIARAYTGAMRYTYEKGLRNGLNPARDLTLRFTILSSGDVDTVLVIGKGSGEPALDPDLTSKAKRMEFDAVGGTPVTVEWDLHYQVEKK